MYKNVATYFEETVIPLIAKTYPEILSEMSIQIRGSHGLGIADEFSDLDAILWLDDPIWRSEGGKIQLILVHDLPPFGSAGILAEHNHPEICVWPLSWLGLRMQFLNRESDLPWEEVTFEELFEIQKNLVLRDSKGIFQRLRETTKPERFPDYLWKKLLIKKLKALDDDLMEYRQVIRRKRMIEESIISGRIQQDLLYLGFLVCRQYYPWRTHLQRVFSKLPVPAPDVLPYIENLSRSQDYGKKLPSVVKAREIYFSHILKKGLLSAEILDNLVWAERLEAWRKEDWHDWITNCQKRAREAGHDPDDFWIWSLWGWK